MSRESVFAEKWSKAGVSNSHIETDFGLTVAFVCHSNDDAECRGNIFVAANEMRLLLQEISIGVSNGVLDKYDISVAVRSLLDKHSICDTSAPSSWRFAREDYIDNAKNSCVMYRKSQFSFFTSPSHIVVTIRPKFENNKIIYSITGPSEVCGTFDSLDEAILNFESSEYYKKNYNRS